MNIQPIEVPERYIHVFPAKLLSGGHPNQKRTFLGGGGRCLDKFSCRGVLVPKQSPDLRSPEVGLSALELYKPCTPELPYLPISFLKLIFFIFLFH